MSFGPKPAATPTAPVDALTQRANGQVAIVGCGPSGCYTALALRRLDPDAHITVFDRRATPFGLIRYGVAPDHQGMKNVSRQFDRLFASEQVNFVGNTVIGEHLPMAALEANFDVVVLASGLPADRPLIVPVDPRARVLAAGQLLRFLNRAPDSTLRHDGPLAPLGAEVVIVGAGNVAMDVARLLCKTDEGFHGSDIDDHAREALEASAIRHLTLLARGPRDSARWDASMYAELCAVPGVSVFLDGDVEERSTTTTTTTSSLEEAAGGRNVRVDIRFNETPVGIDANEQGCLVHTQSAPTPERIDGETRRGVHRADTVITAMGFIDAPDNQWSTGDRVLQVGGCGTGTLGTLADNRALAKTVAQQVLTHLDRDRGRSGLDGVRHLLPPTATTFADWTSIDRAETARARPNRLRTKFTSWSDMSAAITGQLPTSPAHDQRPHP